ncbi:glycoside hydrolase domain-containing protein [Treponema phagedenis]|uniref:glycoside hydrolase domain-containing protein n=1 Tax=Treponema phagedenis TaxID=162 RepID=UPI0011E8014B|nr:glycoside hydrolase domain-containing protein [Treponema phagedenis]QEK07016.1 DUF4091 domain-containing protein [Treponema phagedenis]
MNERIYLLPREGEWYKANMHCHSVFSDGHFAPAELKELYMRKGYSIVAFTDHCIYKNHAELTDSNFLALVGLEVETSEPDTTGGGFDRVKTYHFNIIDTDPEYKKDEKQDVIQPNDWYYGIDEINDYIEKIAKLGFLTAYNHPYWSLQNYDDYKDLKNLWAMEIFNFGCEKEGGYGYAPQSYDEMLRLPDNKKLFCVAGDDNHNAAPVGSPECDSFGGFTMIRAESLTYSAVANALKLGHFYASMGPQIKELYIENGMVHIHTSAVKKISLITEGRRVYVKNAPEDEYITEAMFSLDGKEGYIRVDCIDERGLHANSNAYRIPTIRICQVSSLEKIFKETPLLKKQRNAARVLRGERFSYQVALKLENDADTTETEIRIESAGIPCRVFRVGMIPARLTARKERCDANYITTDEGLFPDVLYPIKIENNLLQEQFILSSEYNECVWIEADIPENIQSGVYTITLTAKAKNRNLQSQAVFTLHVADEVLEKDDFKFTQWFHLDCLADYYGDAVFSEQHWNRIAQFMEMAASHGVSMILTPVFTPPLDVDDSSERKNVQLVDIEENNGVYSFSFERFHRYAALAKKCGIRYLEISHLFTQWGAKHPPQIFGSKNGTQTLLFGKQTDLKDNSYAEFLSVFLPALILEIEKAGFKNRAFFHISDEPSLADKVNYTYAKSMVKKHLGDYPIIDALSHYEFMEDGAAEIPVAAIDSIAPFIAKNVKPLWAYYCSAQAVHVSNRFFAMPSWRNRILGMLLYKFDIDGFLHWGYNFYYTQYSRKLIDPFTVTDAGGAFPAGDSFSVYPGKDEPLPSIRLKVFYEALQDRVFLKQMEKKFGKAGVIERLEKYSGVCADFMQYPTGDKFLLSLRDLFLS